MRSASGRIRICAWVTLVLAGLAGEARADTERVNRTVPLAPGGTVKLHSFSGDVRIRGTERAEVVVNAVRHATRERLDRIKLDIATSGSTVTIEANRRQWSSWWFFHNNNVVDTDFDIEVPARTNLDVHVFSSPVSIAGVTGTFDVKTFSSILRLRDVSGPITAKTFSGDVEIELNPSADRSRLDIDTFSGSVDLRVPATAVGTVNFRSFSGSLTSDIPLALHRKDHRRIEAELTGGREAGSGTATRSLNDVRVKTFSGDVHIRR